MSKGLIINVDIWELLEDLTPEECFELLSCLAAFHRGEEVPEMTRTIRGAYKRIVLDNERFNPEKRAELSAKRSEAGKKGMASRWSITNDNKLYQTITNDNKNNKIEEERSKEEDKNRIDKIRKEEKRKESVRFTPPTPEQVRAYSTKMGYTIDAERFVDYYAAVDWKVGGKAQMKNWEAAVRNWAARDKERNAEKPKPAYVPKDERKISYADISRDMFMQSIKEG